MMRLLTALVLLLGVAAPASALEFQSFTRASTAPHVPTLVAAISPSLVTGTVHVFVTQNGANYTVIIGAGSWTGVTLASVQAQVDAAPADTTIVAAKYEKARVVGLTPCLLRSIAEVLLDETNTRAATMETQLNAIRANIAAASLSPITIPQRTLAQMNTAIDAKVDALGCQ